MDSPKRPPPGDALVEAPRQYSPPQLKLEVAGKGGGEGPGADVSVYGDEGMYNIDGVETDDVYG